MEQGSKAAIVCCSNGQSPSCCGRIHNLEKTLRQTGIVPVLGDCIYAKDSVFSGSGEERAKCLMDFYRDDEIKAIFDISGGDIANEILPYLDFDLIAGSEKCFWGYSDLTTVINAIYAKTGKMSVLYQIRNLTGRDGKEQQRAFSNTLLHGKDDLFSFTYEFVQGSHMEGVAVGGNIRCLLKLAGTEYWPDMTQKILVLESFHGKVPQIAAFLNQLKQIGVFEKISGILLGTFTEMEEEGCVPDITELVKRYVKTQLPIAKTSGIGHGADSKGIVIGKTLRLHRAGNLCVR